MKFQFILRHLIHLVLLVQHNVQSILIVNSLIQMKGIGSWTADCYLMACLTRQDIWPVGDIGLQEGVRRLKNLKERPNVEDMTCLAREWRPFRSVAANLLWADYD